jgi:hypothetical protein
VKNQRLAMETRAANHIFTQQKEAAKQSSSYALGAALDSYATQAQQYSKRGEDGAVSIEWKELERVLPDVIAAQAIYNARHGISNEMELPDGTKQNVLEKQARASAHAKAIETMMARAEFDEADAYLAAVSGEGKYKDDLDAKQIKVAKDAIKNGREKTRIESERAVNETYLDWQLANPEAELTLSMAQEMGLPKEFQVKVMRANQKAEGQRQNAVIANELLPEVIAYDASDDKDRKKGQELYLKIRSLPEEHSGFLSKIFNEQYAASKGVPGAKSKAAVLTEIAGFLLADPKKGTAADFHRGWGKGWTDEEAVRQTALEQDRFLTWVKQTNPTDEEMLEYTQKNPRWSALRTKRNLATFRSTGTGGSGLSDFAPPELRSTQAGYLPAGHRLLNYSE